MRSSFKIVAKLVCIGIFLFYTPFFAGMRQLIEESHFLHFLVARQQVEVEDFSWKNQLNVMSVAKEEEESYSVRQDTIFTSKKTPAAVPDTSKQVSGKKRVYIYDTHQSEEYLGGKTVLDAAKLLGEQLQEAGIEVLVETNSFADYMKENGYDYNDSYLVSANFLNDVLVNYGPFDLMIDFHRDAVPRESSYATIDGKDYARMMFVVGGLSGHSEQTTEICQTLFDKIEQVKPGIMKSTMTREAYYNQQISDRVILVEVGSNNSTYEEVQNSVEVLGEGIIAYLS